MQTKEQLMYQKLTSTELEDAIQIIEKPCLKKSGNIRKKKEKTKGGEKYKKVTTYQCQSTAQSYYE